MLGKCLGKGLDGAGEEDRSELRPREAVACGIINPISVKHALISVLGFGGNLASSSSFPQFY